MTRITVNVTGPLIERATQRDSRHCMIAEAIQAENPHFKNISVDLSTIRWTNPRTRKRYIALTPEPAAAALVEFDQGRTVEPFTFPVETIQSTPVLVAVETTAEAQADGRRHPRKRRGPKGRGGRELKVSPSDGRARIEGGEPLRTGHLAGGAIPPAAADVRRAEAREAAAATVVAEGASNVVRSQSRFRQYGRRLLKP